MAKKPPEAKPIIEQLANRQSRALANLRKIVWKPRTTLPEVRHEIAKLLQDLKDTGN
jgi:hypothetical protein